MKVDVDAGVLFVVTFPVLWLFVVGALSLVGGWRELAQMYPGRPESQPRWLSRFSGARMRAGVSYSSCLKIGADALGLHVQPIWCFAFMHPPLFIPWRDIEYQEERFFWLVLGRFTEKRNGWGRFLAGPSATRQILAARAGAA